MQPLDLTTAPPRAPREALAGIVFLPRTIDKVRATLPGGALGAYNIPGFSQMMLEALGIELERSRAAVAEAAKDDDVAHVRDRVDVAGPHRGVERDGPRTAAAQRRPQRRPRSVSVAARAPRSRSSRSTCSKRTTASISRTATEPDQRVRAAITGVLFIVAGALHFIRPAMYEQIVPPQFGHAGLLVAISGIAEIAGGLGLMIPRMRRAAGFGLVALLLAVWPANIFMAIEAGRFAAVAPAWLLWAPRPAADRR